MYKMGPGLVLTAAQKPRSRNRNTAGGEFLAGQGYRESFDYKFLLPVNSYSKESILLRYKTLLVSQCLGSAH